MNQREMPVLARYYDREFKVETVKIQPGQYYAAGRDMMIVTVLGSCVSACLWDRERCIGGMNHFMLPGHGSGAQVDKRIPVAASDLARMGIYAMELLINQLLKLGAERGRLVAKVFGGGSVLGGMTNLDVGRQNGDFVLEFLREERIPVAAIDLYDDCARKVHFFTSTGKVMVKKLRSVANDTLARREQEYVQRLGELSEDSDVEIFRKRR